MIREALDALMKWHQSEPRQEPARPDQTRTLRTTTAATEGHQERTTEFVPPPLRLSPSPLLKNAEEYVAEHLAGAAVRSVITASPEPRRAYAAEPGRTVALPRGPVVSQARNVRVRYHSDGNEIVAVVEAIPETKIGNSRSESFLARRSDLVLVLGNREVNQGLSNIVLPLVFDRRAVAVVRLSDDPMVRPLLDRYAIEKMEPHP